MCIKNFVRLKLFFLLLIAAFLLFNGGCYRKKAPVSGFKTAELRINKVVVVGFRAAISPGQETDVIRDPLSGAVFMAEPVSDDVVQRMTGILFDRVVSEKQYTLISPGQAKGVISSIVDSDLDVGMGFVEILQKVGKTFEADAVLAGSIYRWREREGTAFAVRRPASVAFDLHLVRPADGAILWKARFDKTQESLFENILDAETFFQSGGRWMKVNDLGMMGLGKLMSDMPGEPKEKEG